MNDNNTKPSNATEKPTLLADSQGLESLADNIAEIVDRAKRHIAKEVNNAMVTTYWNIGRHIVEFEQNGNTKAQYGSRLLSTLAQLLRAKLGAGYSRPNLNNMRKFYLRYPICQTLSDKLSWSHICELMVEYATYGMDSQLFVSKYELYLPNKYELRKLVNGIVDNEPEQQN